MTVSELEHLYALKSPTVEIMDKKNVPGVAVGIYHQGEIDT